MNRLILVESGDHIVTATGHWLVHNVFPGATTDHESLVEIQSLKQMPGYANGTKYATCVVPLALIDVHQVYTPRVQTAVVADAS